jgi:hypothetical protein
MTSFKKSNFRCKARTKAGKRCRAAASAGGLCFFHGNPQKASELGRIGGLKNRHVVPEPLSPPVSLQTPIGVRNTIEDLVAHLYSGNLQPAVASVVTRLLSLQLKVIQTSDFEYRLNTLEDLIGNALEVDQCPKTVPECSSELEPEVDRYSEPEPSSEPKVEVDQYAEPEPDSSSEPQAEATSDASQQTEDEAELATCLTQLAQAFTPVNQEEEVQEKPREQPKETSPKKQNTDFIEADKKMLEELFGNYPEPAEVTG